MNFTADIARLEAPTWDAGARTFSEIERRLHDVVIAPAGEIRRKALRALARCVNPIDVEHSAVVLSVPESDADWPQSSLRLFAEFEQIAELQPSSAVDFGASMRGNYTWRRPDVFGHYDDLLEGYRQHWEFATPPNAQASMLSVSLAAAFSDLGIFVSALADVVHAIVVRAGKPKKTFLANCIDKRRKALMRFITGFFGSHKVDARNTP